MKQLSQGLHCITAPNPGVMTGDGTNTYILGRDEVLVIDPGPAIPEHIDAILNAVGDRIRGILVTHTHADHSPAAAILASKTGVPCYGKLSGNTRFQDLSFKPDTVLEHDMVLTVDGYSLRAIHTPGHVDNHFCFLAEDDGILIAGDHLMSGRTVVIIPPQGDMAEYVASLQRLLNYSIDAIAPGHGGLIKEASQVIQWTIDHRMAREAKVIACLKPLDEATISELVVHVYDDVDQSIHRIAEASLLAHLLKLERDGCVIAKHQGSRTGWQLTGLSADTLGAR